MKYLNTDPRSQQAITGNYFNYWNDLLGLTEPSNYLSRGEAFREFGQIQYLASQGLASTASHDWLIIDGVREKKIFYRGKFSPDGSWEGKRTKKKRNGGRIETGPTLTDADIRAIANEQGNGVWYLPSKPYSEPKAAQAQASNLLTLEWDNGIGFTVLNLFALKGLIPNTITASGGKLDGLSPHAEWLLTRVIDEQSRRYLQYLGQCLGADPNVTNKIFSQFRIPGFHRHSKGKEQLLHHSHHCNATDPIKLVEGAIAICEQLGIDHLKPEEWLEQQSIKASRLNASPADISHIAVADSERLLTEIDQLFPAHSPGSSNGSYLYKVKLASAFKTLLGTDTAKALAPNLFGSTNISWNGLRDSINPIGTIVNTVRAWLNNPHWRLFQWWQDCSKNVSYIGEQIKLAIKKAWETPLFHLVNEGTRLDVSESDYLLHIQSQIKQGKIVLDRRPTGNGKTHGVVHNYRLLFPNGKVYIICPSPRKFPIKGADEHFVRVLGRNNKLWVTVGTELIPYSIDNAPEDAEKRFYCALTPMFHELSSKGHGENIYKGDGSICQTCPFKRECNSQKGNFKYDWRNAVSNDNNLIIHADGIPRDICLDNELISAAIDEVETTLDPYDIISDSYGDLLLGLDHYSDHCEDGISNARKILKAIKPLFDDVSPFGIDHDAVMEAVKDIPLDGIEDLIRAIPQHPPDFSSVMSSGFDEAEEFLDKKQHRLMQSFWDYEDSERLANETAKKLENIPSALLLHLLCAVNGDRRINLSIAHGKLTATIHNPEKYQFLNRFKGLVLLSATGNVEDLSRELCLDKPIEAVWMGQDNPLGNLAINAYRMSGIKSNRLCWDGIKSRVTAVRNHFGNMPCIVPKRWRKNVTSPHSHSFIDADGHWMADSRGSNAFEGQPELLLMSLPKPHLGASQARYRTANGSLEGFTDYYQRLQVREAIQAVGRPRCNRYQDQQFTIHWLIDEDTDLTYLESLGATVNTIPIASIVAEAGSRWDIAKQSITDAIIQLKRDGVAVSQKKIATILGRSQGSLSKLLASHGVTVESLSQEIGGGYSLCLEDTLNKRNTLENQSGQGLQEMMVWAMGHKPQAILEDVATVTDRQGWQEYLNQLKDYPAPRQLKALATIRAYLELEAAIA